MLFQVKSIANLRDYRNVPITWFATKRAAPLFGPKGTTGIPYHHLIDGYGDQDTDVTCAEIGVEEYFTYEEAWALICLLHTHDDPTARIAPAKLPLPRNAIGYSAIAVGGATGFIVPKVDAAYVLPFNVVGYFDVRGCPRRFVIEPCPFDDDLSGLGRNIAHNLDNDSFAMNGGLMKEIIEDLHAWTGDKYAATGLMPVAQAVEMAIGVWRQGSEARRDCASAEADAKHVLASPGDAA